jgi:hypothetical protein
MATESSSDPQLRRRRRDPEEPEKTELSTRAQAVAVAQENDEENEERWVGPLPVEATLAKKRKGSCRERPWASWSSAFAEGGLIARKPARLCDGGVCVLRTGSRHSPSGHLVLERPPQVVILLMLCCTVDND